MKEKYQVVFFHGQNLGFSFKDLKVGRGNLWEEERGVMELSGSRLWTVYSAQQNLTTYYKHMAQLILHVLGCSNLLPFQPGSH